MNTIRITDIFIRKFYTNKKAFLIFAGIFFLIKAIYYLIINLRTGNVISGEFHSLSIGGDVIAIILAAGLFPFIELTDKKNEVLELMYPALRTEKFLFETLLTFIIVPLSIIVLDLSAFYSAEIITLLSVKSLDIEYSMPHFSYMFNSITESRFSDWVFTAGFVIISFSGAIIFRKLRLLKTWFLIGITVLAVFLTGVFVLYVYHKATGHWFPYSLVQEVTGYENNQYTVADVAYYNGQRLDYIPWFFNFTVWTVIFAVIFALLYCYSWLRYKKERV